jgi:hypothetical protein
MLSNNSNVTQHTDAVRRDELGLDSRYREIGISAVAAALQFRCEGPRTGPMYPSLSHGEHADRN